MSIIRCNNCEKACADTHAGVSRLGVGRAHYNERRVTCVSGRRLSKCELLRERIGLTRAVDSILQVEDGQKERAERRKSFRIMPFKNHLDAKRSDDHEEPGRKIDDLDSEQRIWRKGAAHFDGRSLVQSRAKSRSEQPC